MKKRILWHHKLANAESSYRPQDWGDWAKLRLLQFTCLELSSNPWVRGAGQLMLELWWHMLLLFLQGNSKLEQTATARWRKAERNRKLTGSVEGTDGKSTGSRQEVYREQKGSPQGVSRRSAGADRKLSEGKQEGASFFTFLSGRVPPCMDYWQRWTDSRFKAEMGFVVSALISQGRVKMVTLEFKII